MLNDLKVGFLSAKSSIKRGNKKTSFFIIFVLALIFMNLIFLPSLINGMMGLFVGFVQDYTYGNIVVEPVEEKIYIENVDNVLKKIRSVTEVTGVAKRIEAGASLRYKQNVVGANIIGLIPKEEVGVSQYPNIVKYGEFLGELSRDEILLGSMIAGVGTGSEIYDNLGEVKVGSLINVTYSNGVERTYKVKGIHEGTFELTDLNAIVHFKELESVLGIEGEQKATSVVVRIANEGEEAYVKDKIIDVGVKEDVFTWQEKAETLVKQALQSIGSIDTMSKIVSLIVGASLIFIIIYINTLNRKKEIGILRAVGVSPNSIRISYIFISLFYVSLGIFLGLIMFFGLVFYFTSNPIVFYETLKIVPKVDFILLIKSILIMVGMSVVAGFIPAWFVTRQDMLEAIWGR
ncbi:MAG: FtsX-like permease family protein [Nanoarchaeota archaeon]|nr:FtsX-like permease family protein [Nanoarchaeota archaeon]MBU0963028.1 FtsX-like permease family protein [Nanoarchaeota archaeon]